MRKPVHNRGGRRSNDRQCTSLTTKRTNLVLGGSPNRIEALFTPVLSGYLALFHKTIGSSWESATHNRYCQEKCNCQAV